MSKNKTVDTLKKHMFNIIMTKAEKFQVSVLINISYMRFAQSKIIIYLFCVLLQKIQLKII